jgi:hypothetical protein
MVVADAVGPMIPVYPAAPANITPPCVLVRTGRAVTQARAGHWDIETLVTVVGPPGDNAAAADTMDELLFTVAIALSEGLSVPALWDQPAGQQFAGGTFLASTITVNTRVEVPSG